ncbi:MAG: (2Fe-2S)-binding protein [Kofleriaceae bacterium]
MTFLGLKGIFNFNHPGACAMIVCLCYAVRDRDLDAAIAGGAATVEEVGRACGAGTGCGACLGDVEDSLMRSGGCGDCPAGRLTVRSRQSDERSATS